MFFFAMQLLPEKVSKYDLVRFFSLFRKSGKQFQALDGSVPRSAKRTSVVLAFRSEEKYV
jgi:hypothetical protein